MNEWHQTLEAFLYKKSEPNIYDGLFPAQKAFVDDSSTLLCALTDRRAGKTNAMAAKLYLSALKHPHSICPYIALTYWSAENILWPVMKEMKYKFHLPLELKEASLTAELPNGSKIPLLGANTKDFMDKLRGPKYPIVGIDEAASFRTHLKPMIEEILLPAVSDYNGQIAMVGTPGPIPIGYFYEATTKSKAWKVHQWSWRDNPYLPNQKQFIDKLMDLQGWDEQNPTYLREWCGKWVMDADSLLIHYSADKSHYENLPPSQWDYILGIDLGYVDADALAVLAHSDASESTYLVEESVLPKQGLTELVADIQRMQSRYPISKMMIDEGGLGKKIAEELRRRYQIPVQPADKARKMENIAFLNDALRAGRFKAKSTSRFAQDSYLVEIDREKSTPDRIKVKDTFHSDIIDAVLYAFKESYAFSYQAKIKAPTYGSQAWADQEVTEMERAAEVYWREQMRGNEVEFD